jgi:hypothetical protein
MTKEIIEIYRDLDEWLAESKDKILRTPLGYHTAYLHMVRGQLAEILGEDVKQEDVTATLWLTRSRNR